MRKPGPRRSLWPMNLPLPLILAVRYLRSSRRDAYVSFLSVLAIGGISLGVAALIIVLAALSGLQNFLRTDLLSRTPHIEVELAPDLDSEAMRQALSEIAGVLETRRILRGRGWLLAGGGALDVSVVGYEGSLPRFFPRADDAGDDAGPGLYVGDTLAARWGIAAGDLVEMVSARPTLTPFGAQPRIHQLRLAGTFRTGRTEDENQRIALPLDVARRLFGDRQTRIELRAADLDAALGVAARVAALVGDDGRVKTWQDLNQAFFFALKLEKRLMFVTVFLVVLVAGMALVTTLALLISSKRTEIGMLQAMGATGAELRRTFLTLGFLLGAVGLSLGCALGISGSWLLERFSSWLFELLGISLEVYFIDHIPFRIELGDLLAVLLATAFLTTVSTVYAASRATSLNPVEAFRL